MKPLSNRVIVCFPFVGDFVGGSHFSALGLIKNLGGTRFEPLVVVHRSDGPLVELLNREGVDYEVAPVANELRRAGPRNGSTALTILQMTLPLARFLRSRKVSAVHTNDGRSHVTWGLAARAAGVKLIWHHRSDPSSFGLRFIAPLLAHHVVTVSQFAMPRGGLFTSTRKISVVHSPFDVSIADKFTRQNCRDAIVAEIGCTSDTILLGYVGTLVERKRPKLFVDVIAAMRRKSPDTRAIALFFGSVIGDLDKAIMKRAEELNVSDCIRFMGFRYPGESWVAGLNFLLVPSIDEPLGRTLVEAMLLRTPVIATDSGGNPEAIKDGKTGWLVSPEDPEAFAEAVLTRSGNSLDLDAITKAAQRDARERFSIERHIGAIGRIYDQIGI